MQTMMELQDTKTHTTVNQNNILVGYAAQGRMKTDNPVNAKFWYS